MVIQEILRLSYRVVSEYYHNNLAPFFEYIDDNILWIGPADKQLLRSKAAIISAWSREKPDMTFSMGNVTEYPIPLTPKCCNVILTYPVYTHYPDGSTQLHNQRMDFTWAERRITDEAGSTKVVPRIVKLHISNGVRIDDKDFIYAVHSKDIDTGQVTRSTPGTRLLFGGKDGLTYHFLSDSILWIEKLDKGKYTVVHTDTKDIPSNKNTDYFSENYPGVFLAPHMSYLVNPIHIKTIQRFKLTLDNGRSLSIPEKKYTKFKAEFYRWSEQYNSRWPSEKSTDN